MGQRNMHCSSQMIDLETEHQGPGYLHPEPCLILGGITNFPQPDIQTVVPASANGSNLDVHPSERYESAIFYGMPQYHGLQHHPYHHAPNLELPVAPASNFYVPYMNPPSAIPVSLRSCDQLPFAALGVSVDDYGPSSQYVDNARGSSKRKNAEGHPGNFHYLNASGSSSSAALPLNTSHPDGVAVLDTTLFAPPQHGGNAAPLTRDVGSHRSVRNRSGVAGLDPVLAHNQHSHIQGSFLGQPFQPTLSLWMDLPINNSSTDTGPPMWTHGTPIHYMHGNNFVGGSAENGNMGPQLYQEPANSRSNSSFLHPSVNFRHHNFLHPSPPIQGMRGQNISVPHQVTPTSFRTPSSYASYSCVNPSQDGFDVRRHPRSVQPTGIRIYRSHQDGIIPDTSFRHRNLPHLRVLPDDEVAVLDFDDYYEVENYVDHHRDMRLDIEDMSYEELLALGERIGNVKTGLSEEIIESKLKTRIYMPSRTSINLEESASSDQESDACIICQDDYKIRDKIGVLGCRHEYHLECLKKWLCVKNVCPICKCEAVTAGPNDK